MTRAQTNEQAPPVRVGVIGAGWPGERHAEGYLATPGCRLVAVADSHPERGEIFAARYGRPRDGLGIETHKDYEKLLADESVDAVSVALPNFLHHPATIAALEAGKHVLCEKPPALNAAEARAMADAANRSGKLLAYALQRRFSPAVEAVHAAVAAGELGEVYHARAVWTRAWGVPSGVGAWFTDPARAGGGALIDIGVHALDMAWYLMGCPRPLTVSGQVFNKFPDQTKTDDSAFALVRFDDGRSLHLETSWVLAQADDEFAAHLYGTRGGARVSDNRLDVYTVGAAERTVRGRAIQAGWQQAFLKQAANFIGAIRGDVELRTPAEHGARVMAMIDGIYKSAGTRREVALDATDAL